MKAWTELLPVFVVRWLARRNLERLVLRDCVVVQARPDVLFVIRRDWND